MNVRTILTKTATATAFAGVLAFAGACAHHDTVASGDNDYGRVAQNQPATSVSDNGATPIPGPVKVDSTGAAYTSSAAPGNGNSAAVGTNTNVQIIPKNTTTGSSSVTYSEAQNTAPAPTVVETPVVTAPTTTETTTTETTTTTVPMTSSTTETVTTPAETPAPAATPAPEETTTTTHHKRMRKD